MQGFTGGVLIPMAFTLVITLLPPAKQPIGLALFALSATFAPAIGPTIGGYLTENYGWQYDLLRQPGAGRGDAAAAVARCERAPMQLACCAGRLARHRHDGPRAWRPADRARRRQPR